jgi:hypothetical protein
MAVRTKELEVLLTTVEEITVLVFNLKA